MRIGKNKNRLIPGCVVGPINFFYKAKLNFAGTMYNCACMNVECYREIYVKNWMALLVSEWSVCCIICICSANKAL